MCNVADKYAEAIELYRTTELSLVEIGRRCGVTHTGLSAYICRRHRDLLLQRNGLSGDPARKIRRNKGQRPESRQKYRDAIEACDSEEYIHLNVSQVARLFGLDGNSLAKQLHAHYPDVIPRREAERQRRGLADNNHRGARKTTLDAYADAVRILEESDVSIERAAQMCNVSFTGLREHLLHYHKKIVEKREARRRHGKEYPTIGEIAGNGRLRLLAEDAGEKYARGVELYRSTSLSVTEIALQTGVNLSSFRNHLRMWHRHLMLQRRDNSAVRPAPDSASGMITLPNGRSVLRRSYEKYRDAIDAYATTTESLNSIAARLGLTCNSLGGFIRRNLPEIIAAHNSLRPVLNRDF